jgi:hypothetical protein
MGSQCGNHQRFADNNSGFTIHLHGNPYRRLRNGNGQRVNHGHYSNANTDADANTDSNTNSDSDSNADTDTNTYTYAMRWHTIRRELRWSGRAGPAGRVDGLQSVAGQWRHVGDLDRLA